MEAQRNSTTHLPLAGTLVASVAATAVAVGLMFWARAAYQIRTLPERIMEWLLLFIPVDLFEKGLQTLGATAKEVALVAAYVVMAAALVGLAIVAIRSSARTIAFITIALWLFAMAIVMPVTGAGFFATGLFQDVLLTNVSYAGVALAYATILFLARSVLVGRAVGTQPNAAAPATPTEPRLLRRSFVGALAGTAVAYVATFWLGHDAGSSGSSLPLASVGNLSTPLPSTPELAPTATIGSSAAVQVATETPAATLAGSISAATPMASTNGVATTSTPGAASTPTVGAGATPTAGAAVPTATTVAAPVTAPTATPVANTNVIPPAPQPVRSVARDKDGALAGAAPPPGQVSPLYTPNGNFYITTKNAGGDPVVDASKWRLVIDGEVASPVQLDLRGLYQLPSFRFGKTLECISNFVKDCEQVPFGCNLISNATWKGARLSDVLALAGGLKSGVQSIAMYSVDEYVASIPADSSLLSQTYLVYAMNGAVLPLEHGYPARVLTPGRYGLKSPKWVIGIRPMRTVFVDWFGQRGWNHDGIVNAMTRIDLPINGQTLAPGDQPIAGVAYGGLSGIGRVEFSADGGKSWKTATLMEDATGRDSWVRWNGSFAMPASGSVNLVARNIDRNGTRQTEANNLTQPNGATGLRIITVKAGTA